MSDTTGNSAGKIWQYLDTSGPASATKIMAATKLSKNEVQRAIGWLACEKKLNFEINGRTETISLL